MADECVNRLALVLDERIKQLNDKPPSLDFGEIKDNSLMTNNFPIPIPINDCVLCGSVSQSYTGRVLVAWVGDDAVVIDTIAANTNTTK